MNDRLQAINDSKHGETKFGYTSTGHLEHTHFGDGSEEFRTADKVGNLFDTKERNDRTYAHGGRLEKKGSWHYTYDEEGFLIEKYKAKGGMFASRTDVWRYEWNASGMLEKVIRPDKNEVTFTYDALGRRLSKKFKNTTTKWLWDGNVPLHEWKENSRGEVLSSSSVGDNGVITWVFEENSFIPTAKLKNDKKFSILADHLGTPTAMYNQEGETVWERSLNTFGGVKEGNHGACPFMYQGQYYDAEIELAYNRFRYYSPETGRYISKDPIGLLSGENGLYNYVGDPNGYVDRFGLAKHYGSKNKKRAKWGENDYARGGKKRAIDHIWEGHAFHRAPDGKSKFRENINSKDKVKSMVNESVRPENLISTNADGTRNYGHTFDHSIGTDINGNSTKQMIVHTDANGWVQSAYPL